MTLNPIQFGTEVIDQFGRYLRTTFPIADQEMEAQVRDHLKHDVGGERLIAKGPYVYLTRPFAQGPSVADEAHRRQPRQEIPAPGLRRLALFRLGSFGLGSHDPMGRDASHSLEHRRLSSIKTHGATWRLQRVCGNQLDSTI